MRKVWLLAALVGACQAPTARAEVKTKTVTYECDGVKLKGYLAWDDAAQGKRPGVLVVHEWWGLNDYARKRAEQLAGLGYVAFACDMYGAGKSTEHPKEAAAMAGAVRKNLDTWLGRARAGLKVLQGDKHVDASRVAAIGYCFGGSTVQQLAFHGADLAAVVSFHGAPVVPTDASAGKVKAKILLCTGALDPFIPEAKLHDQRRALDQLKADYQMIFYGGAQHSFTVPDIGARNVKGLAYNAEADRRSWQDMLQLFRETLNTKKTPGRK